MMSIRHRLFAALYDRMNAAAERRWMGKHRADLLADARGVVLEIGGGTGANLPYYRDVERLIVAEPDPFMRKKLEPKLAQARASVEVSEADAQRLPFADESFDTVVSTLVFCTIPDPYAALAEIRRVLRPGGKDIVPRACAGRREGGPLAGPYPAPLELAARRVSPKP
jgi:ubiquinone/menaquinone biosynthesis C-methylase UbiE